MSIFKSKKVRNTRRRREKAFNELNKWEGKLEKAARNVEKLKEELEDVR